MHTRQSYHTSQSGSACTSYASVTSPSPSPSPRLTNLRGCIRFPTSRLAPAQRQHCRYYLARRLHAFSDFASVQTATPTSQQTETLPVGSDDVSVVDTNVQTKLDQLHTTVQEQQRLLQLQQETIQVLQEKLLGLGPPSTLTPLEAQRLADLDQRSVGQFDARFHSISW
jgi:hypothetical protein